MIEIVHRDTGAVILAVEGEWRYRIVRYAHLDNIDLHGKALAEAELGFANLRGANLADVDFTNADLTGANFNGADLSRANLRSADLHSVTLSKANLTDADLSYATLQSADWRGAILTGANLSRATFKGGRYDQYTVWPKGFVPEKHHLVYLPSTSKRNRRSQADTEGTYLKDANEEECEEAIDETDDTGNDNERGDQAILGCGGAGAAYRPDIGADRSPIDEADEESKDQAYESRAGLTFGFAFAGALSVRLCYFTGAPLRLFPCPQRLGVLVGVIFHRDASHTRGRHSLPLLPILDGLTIYSRGRRPDLSSRFLNVAAIRTRCCLIADRF